MLLVLGALCCGPVGCRILHAPKATTMNDEILAKLDASQPVQASAESSGVSDAGPIAVSATESMATTGGDHRSCDVCARHALTGHSKPSVAPPAPQQITPTPPPAPAPAPVVRTAPPPAPAKATSGARTHTVKKGETLQKISQEHYGTTRRWMQIFEANKSSLENPDRVQVGMKLQIP
jgi:LysM repeat protein